MAKMQDPQVPDTRTSNHSYLCCNKQEAACTKKKKNPIFYQICTKKPIFYQICTKKEDEIVCNGIFIYQLQSEATKVRE